MKVKEVLEYLEEIAPPELAESYDNVGLLVGDGDAVVTGICCCLDITPEIIGEAEAKDANLIVSHHPVIFDGLKKVEPWNPVFRLVKDGVAAIGMHTNFDICENGVNDTLLELLGFEKSEVLEVTRKDGMGFGAVCELPIGFTAKGLAEHCKNTLDLACVKYGKAERNISRVAVCCGSGIDDSTMQAAAEKNIDAIISGDIKHNYWVEALNRGIVLIDAGHYGTEKAASHRFAELITKKFPGVPVFSAESEKEPAGYC